MDETRTKEALGARLPVCSASEPGPAQLIRPLSDRALAAASQHQQQATTGGARRGWAARIVWCGRGIGTGVQEIRDTPKEVRVLGAPQFLDPKPTYRRGGNLLLRFNERVRQTAGPDLRRPCMGLRVNIGIVMAQFDK